MTSQTKLDRNARHVIYNNLLDYRLILAANGRIFTVRGGEDVVRGAAGVQTWLTRFASTVQWHASSRSLHYTYSPRWENAIMTHWVNVCVYIGLRHTSVTSPHKFHNILYLLTSLSLSINRKTFAIISENIAWTRSNGIDFLYLLYLFISSCCLVAVRAPVHKGNAGTFNPGFLKTPLNDRRRWSFRQGQQAKRIE